jgi:hypothetical protein
VVIHGLHQRRRSTDAGSDGRTAPLVIPDTARGNAQTGSDG